MVAPFQPDPEKVAAIRAALPATGAGLYLDTGSAGPLAVEGLRAMRDLIDHEARIGRVDAASGEAFEERAAETRAVLAALVGAEPDAIALTPGATAAMADAAWAPAWRAGDRLVTTDQEHPAVLAALRAVSARFGLELVQVPAGPDPAGPDPAGADEAPLLERFEAALTPRTRLVALSHVTWRTGVRLPIGPLSALARRVGAWVAVDGAQAVGAIPVEVAEAAPDVYALSGYKWLLGPHGVGAAVRSPRFLAEAQPGPGGRGQDDGLGGSWHRPSVVALGRTVGWLEMYVGLGWALMRARDLAAHAWAGLAAVAGVALLTPGPPPAGLVAFRIAGWPASVAAEALARHVFALVHVVADLDAIRISVAWFNTAAELDRFVAAVAALAAATPATLPERPRLVVLPADDGVDR